MEEVDNWAAEEVSFGDYCSYSLIKALKVHVLVQDHVLLVEDHLLGQCKYLDRLVLRKI